jgi:hypothetical protein
MARPSKLTGEVRLTICDGIRLGVTFEEACKRAGVAPSTGWEWRARGEGRDPRRRATTRYVLFAEEVAGAEGEGFAEPPQNRCETGEAAGFSSLVTAEDQPAKASESQRPAEFAERPADPSTSQHNHEEEGGEEPSERAWLSQRSRRRASILDMDF